MRSARRRRKPGDRESRPPLEHAGDFAKARAYPSRPSSSGARRLPEARGLRSPCRLSPSAGDLTAAAQWTSRQHVAGRAPEDEFAYASLRSRSRPAPRRQQGRTPARRLDRSVCTCDRRPAGRGGGARCACA
jgi:hypothetical protein